MCDWEAGRDEKPELAVRIMKQDLLKLIGLYNERAAAVGMVTPTWPSARSLQTTLAALRVNLINGFFNSSLWANGKIEANPH